MHRHDIVSNVANRWEAHAALAFMLTEAILGLIRDDSIRHEHGDHNTVGGAVLNREAQATTARHWHMGA